MSSTETGPSKRSTGVVDLGKRIVSELGLDDRSDILSRWMSHRIAELMTTASEGRTKAEREAAAVACESLILRLWERRTSWPNGWPPPVAAKIIERLSEAEDDLMPWQLYRPQVADDGAKGWSATLPLIADLQRSEREIWRDAALHDVDVKSISNWLESHGAQIDASEREPLESIVAAVEQSRCRRERRYDPRIEGDVRPAAWSPVKALRELQRRRKELMARAMQEEDEASQGGAAAGVGAVLRRPRRWG